MVKRNILAAAAAGCMLLTPNLAGAAAPQALPGSALLAQGAANTQVRILQADLAAVQDSPGPIDGDFGPRTLAAVQAFQRQAGVKVDGIVGPVTWGALQSALGADYHVNADLQANGADYGDVGAAVVQLQQDLVQSGYDPGPINGVYLASTAQAVRAFERHSGLTVTLKVAGQTLAAIAGGTGSGGASAQGGAATAQSGSGASVDGHPVIGTMQLTATAYGPSLQDNYPYGPVDYYGNPLVAGDVAVDPSVIPLGSLLWVSGYSSPYLPQGGFLARAVDTGGAIQGSRIDLFINATESQVSSFGVQRVEVQLLGQ